MSNDLYERSVDYHRRKPYGKLKVVATKRMKNQDDLMLAYSPGVAEPCRRIQANPMEAAELTIRSELVAVITNGTAVLGLGDIGPLAAKPVMEGKSILFQKFAGLNSFDIEVDEKDPDQFIKIVKSLEPTFGGINLEDIKAPECFYIEQELQKIMKIPVFHDDQHGTAIIVAAALTNALVLNGKSIDSIRVVCSGAGAAALSCLNVLVEIGLKKENIIVFDRSGVVNKKTANLDPFKAVYAVDDSGITIGDALDGADVFLGLSSSNVIGADDVMRMAKDPVIFGLANPEPEIRPEVVKSVRTDVIIATGRSDYPNQVNNVLCFPFLFRGALDVGATSINWEMKKAALYAIAQVAREENSPIVSAAYGGEIHQFGPEFIIPKPFDPRLFVNVSYAVARAAVETGVAERPIVGEEHWQAYRESLENVVYKSNHLMRPIFRALKKRSLDERLSKRLVFAEGESRRVLEAVQMVIDESIAHPILIGRPEVIRARMQRLGLRFAMDDITIIDPNNDDRFHTYWSTYHEKMGRSGITKDLAKFFVRTQPTLIGALMIHLGDADAMVCGVIGRYKKHFEHVEAILGESNATYAALGVLALEDGPLFIADTHLNDCPDAETLARIGYMAAKQARAFDETPKVAFVSHSSFGSERCESTDRMKKARDILISMDPTIEVEGEISAQLAWNPNSRHTTYPYNTLTDRANIWIAPNIEAAHMVFYSNKVIHDHPSVGPLLLGLKAPVHITTSTVSARGLFNYACVTMHQLGV